MQEILNKSHFVSHPEWAAFVEWIATRWSDDIKSVDSIFRAYLKGQELYQNMIASLRFSAACPAPDNDHERFPQTC